MFSSTFARNVLVFCHVMFPFGKVVANVAATVVASLFAWVVACFVALSVASVLVFVILSSSSPLALLPIWFLQMKWRTCSDDESDNEMFFRGFFPSFMPVRRHDVHETSFRHNGRYSLVTAIRGLSHHLLRIEIVDLRVCGSMWKCVSPFVWWFILWCDYVGDGLPSEFEGQVCVVDEVGDDESVFASFMVLQVAAVLFPVVWWQLSREDAVCEFFRALLVIWHWDFVCFLSAAGNKTHKGVPYPAGKNNGEDMASWLRALISNDTFDCFVPTLFLLRIHMAYKASVIHSCYVQMQPTYNLCLLDFVFNVKSNLGIPRYTHRDAVLHLRGGCGGIKNKMLLGFIEDCQETMCTHDAAIKITVIVGMVEISNVNWLTMAGRYVHGHIFLCIFIYIFRQTIGSQPAGIPIAWTQ